MNNFIKLPLFLGITCLVAGGLLAGAAAITDPIIERAKMEKLAKGFRLMYDDESALPTKSLTEKELGKDVVNEKGILSITKVTHSEVKSVVYQMRSKSSWETLTFYIGFDEVTKTVDGYYCLETTVQSQGYGNFKKNEEVTEKYLGYDGTGSVIMSGTTFTSNAVQKAVDIAHDDLENRDWGE